VGWQVNLAAKGIVFLDRDGTINKDRGYVYEPERLELIDGAAQGIALLKASGFSVLVVSNQSAIGRGLCSREDVDRANELLRRMLLDENEGAIIDEIIYCPHAPDQDCGCRKPLLGMIENLSKRWEIVPESCWSIGDKVSDLNLGLNIGIPLGQCLLLKGGGEEAQTLAYVKSNPGVCLFDRLFNAAAYIVGEGN